MKVRVIFRNPAEDICEFEYFSEFKRINDKYIKSEIKRKILEKYGSKYYRYSTIENIYRID